MNIYLRLYYEFFKTGLFAVGGGMATLPFLHDVGETTGWYTQTKDKCSRQNKATDIRYYLLNDM